MSKTSVRNWALALEPRGFHQVVVVDDPPVVEPVEELVITRPLGFTLTGSSLDQA